MPFWWESKICKASCFMCGAWHSTKQFISTRVLTLPMPVNRNVQPSTQLIPWCPQFKFILWVVLINTVQMRHYQFLQNDSTNVSIEKGKVTLNTTNWWETMASLSTNQFMMVRGDSNKEPNHVTVVTSQSITRNSDEVHPCQNEVTFKVRLQFK